VLAITGEMADLAEATAGEAGLVLVNARRTIARRGAQASGRQVAAAAELEIILAAPAHRLQPRAVRAHP
jgi:hypothetical protein